MKLILGKNSTSQSITIFIQDSSASSKTGLTGIDYTEVNAWYYKTGEYHSHQISLTNSNVGIWQSGGFVEIDAINMPGFYQLQLPDIVTTDDSMSLADNAVAILVKDAGANNVTPVTIEIQLNEYSMDDIATTYDTIDANITQILGVATDGTFNANITEVNGSSVAVSTSVDANVVAVNGTEVSDVITAGETVPSNLVEINGNATIDVGSSAPLTPYEWYQQVYTEIENVREDVLNIECSGGGGGAVTIAANGITAASFSNDSITAAAIANGAIDALTFAAGAIDAAAIANNAIDIATFAADVKTGAALKANVETVTAGAITAAAIADNAIDIATFAADVKTGAALKANVETITAGVIATGSFAAGAITSAVVGASALDSIDTAVTVGTPANFAEYVMYLVNRFISKNSYDTATGELVLENMAGVDIAKQTVVTAGTTTTVSKVGIP